MEKHPKAPTNEKIPEGYRRLEGSLRAERKGSRRVGPADPAEKVLVSVYVRRKPGAPPLPDQAFWVATPPGKRKFLSREEFAALHGAAPEDLQAVVDFAQSHGLDVVETNAARRVVQVSGTVAQVSEAFAVTLHRYEWQGESYRGREGYIHLPNNLADIVEGVFGLDTRKMARRHDGPAGSATLTPPQVAGLYNFPTTGASGETIAILEFAAPDTFGTIGGGYKTADIHTFFSGLGLADPTLIAVGVDGATNNPTGDAGGPDGEIALDIEVAGSVAPGAKLAVYFAPIGTEQDWADIVTTAVNDATNKPSVISTSWGWTELQADAPTGDPASPWPFEWSQALMNKMSTTLQEAASLGVTVFFSSGDNGSDCQQGDGHAHVIYPSSDPWVTSCGGTVITNVSGSSFNENTWQDSAFTTPGATGGGVSENFDLPAWQVGFGIPPSINAGHHVGRGVPDIAGNASFYSGYNIVVDGSTNQTGGTSAVAPLYAGLIAIINKSLGEPVGYLNPTLYALAADPGVTGLFRDINDGVSNGFNGAPGYTSGPGWDACTGLGVVNGQNLLSCLQGIYAKSVTITTDRDHFGQDEVDAARTQPGGAVFKGAFFVTVDGFTPAQLGITNSSSLGAAPVVNFSPSTGLTNPAVCSSLQSDDPSFGPEVQRFRFGYDVNFGGDDSAFTSFTGDSETVTLSTTFQGISANAQVHFIKQPDPYILQGPQTWWLSNDIRLVQVKEGGSAFGVPFPSGGDPLAFLASLTSALEGGQGTAGGQNFNDNTDEDTEVITVAPDDGHGHKVYNFAIARVHYQGLASTAHKVRVFFRIFAANSTATYFEPDSTFRRYAAYSPVYPVPPADDFQNVLPEMGLASGEYVTLPFFGETRQDPAQSGSANTLPGLQTPDGRNARDLPPTGGPLHDYFYGCWLDINQTDPSSPARMPAMPPMGNEDGPWPGLSLEPIQQAFITNDHNCIVAEVAFDPVPISTGVAPFNTDKMAQRNISWSYVANPGVEASRRALEPFEVRPTPSILSSGEAPDELMIDWNNVPVGQHAEIYLPAVDAQAVVDKAIELYHAERLTRVDAHTIGCTTGGVSYIPLPKGAGDGANFVALMSVDLPYGIRKGQKFTVLVRQVTNASGKPAPPPPPPPPPIQIKMLQPPARPKQQVIQWRRVLGTFQVNIPVSTKEQILPREERRFSIFRWIGDAMPPQRRWYPVFQRYLTYIGQKVQALGGDPTKILPSPSGDGGRPKPSRREECRLAYTGKIVGLIFDHFGDFEGFILETEEKEHTFRSREKDVAELAQHVWRDRLRITVLAECDEAHHPLTMIVREPPALFSH